MGNASLLLPLLQNAAMLLIMVVIYAISGKRFGFRTLSDTRFNLPLQISTGFLMGGIGIAIILTPVQYSEDVIFDTRSVLISLTGLFFGWLPVTITMLLTAIFRLFIGGVSAWTGVLVILSSGLLGLLWRHYSEFRLQSIKAGELFAFGLLVHVAMLLMLLTLPDAIQFVVIRDTLVPVMLVYPLATVVMGKLLGHFLDGERVAFEASENAQRLRMAMSASGQDLFELNLQTGELVSLSQEETTHKYPGRKFHQNLFTLMDDMHPDDRNRVAAAFLRMKEAELDSWNGEFRQGTDAGGWAWIFAACQVVSKDAQGRPLLVLGTYLDITARKQIEEELRVFRELIDNSSDVIEVIDPHNGRILDVNVTGCKALGYTREEMLQLSVFDIDPGVRPDSFLDEVKNLDNNANFAWESLHQRKDGSTYPVEVNLKYVRLGKDYLVAVVRDISERKQTQDALQLAAMVYQHSREGMMVTDNERRIIDVNPMFTKVTGYDKVEIIGKTPSVLHSGLQSDDFYKSMWAELNTQGHWSGEIWNKRKNGQVYPEWLSVNAVYDADGKPQRWVAQFTDISDKKDAQEQIWRQANIDSITGLPNRSMFLDRLKLEISRARRSGTLLSLLFLDLDRFKEVNDSLGHDIGDLLLQQAAGRLRASVRESDTVARLGGDEFILILNDLKETPVVGAIAHKVIMSMAEPFDLNGNKVYISASAGITIYPNDGDTPEILLKNADQAMYKAKREGRNRYHYFTAAMQEEVDYRARLLNDLRLALQLQQLQVHYQPIVEMVSGRIVKVEALVRWQHPERGMISPANFIPLAEESGLIVPLGNMVLREALLVLQKLQDICPLLQVSVNKSPAQFGSNDDLWIEELKQSELASNRLIVEITEGLLLDERPAVQEHLEALLHAGIKVAIDDFGTGYSSLSYLKKFKISYLKIDQSFVMGMAAGNEDHSLCDAMITMAHRLGIKVIAEGVETELQRDLLLASGCDFGQGYYFSHALPYAQLETLLKTTLPANSAGTSVSGATDMHQVAASSSS